MRATKGGSRQTRIVLAAVMAATFAGHSADGSTYTWVGNSDGFWHNPANWSPAARPPSSPDTVIVFGPVGVSGANSVNDIIGSFQLNNLTFLSTKR